MLSLELDHRIGRKFTYAEPRWISNNKAGIFLEPPLEKNMYYYLDFNVHVDFSHFDLYYLSSLHLVNARYRVMASMAKRCTSSCRKVCCALLFHQSCNTIVNMKKQNEKEPLRLTPLHLHLRNDHNPL